MSEAGCFFCPMVQALETGEAYRAPSGEVSRRVALLPSAVAVLGYDQYYPGYTLVISRRHATELYHLPDAESQAYFGDMLRVARAIDRAFSPRKMNYELLGNTVPHLHAHVLPRYADDPRPGWPFPWPDEDPPPFPEDEVQRDAAALRQALSDAL